MIIMGQFCQFGVRLRFMRIASMVADLAGSKIRKKIRLRKTPARKRFLRGEVLESRDLLTGDLDFAQVFGSAARAGNTVGEAIAIDGAGNRYVTGSFSSDVDFDFRPSVVQRIQPTGEANAFVAKYAPDGRLIWLKNIGGSGRVDGKAISVDVNYNVYVAGYFTQTADFDPGAGTANRTSTGDVNTFVVKLTAAGNFAFVATTGAATGDHSLDLALDPAGAPVVAGSFTGSADFDPGPGTATRNAGATTNAFVWKLTQLGTFVYASTVAGEQNTGNGLAVEASGNAILVGEYDGAVDFDPSASGTVGQPGFYGAYVLKLDAAGQFVNVAFLDGNAYLADVDVDSEGNIYSAGLLYQDVVDFDPNAGSSLVADFNNGLYFVWKLTAAGNLDYVSAFSSDATSFGFANIYQIVVDPFDRAMVVGDYFGVLDFDPLTGNQILDAGFSSDAFMWQIDALGNFLQVTVASDNGTAAGQASAHGAALTPDNNAVMTGPFEGTVEFDPNSPVEEKVAAGNSDLYLAEYKTVGGVKFIQVSATGAAGNVGDAGHSVAVDSLGNYYVAGEYSGTADFDSGPAAVTRNTPKTLNAFVAKYSPTGQLIWVKTWDGADSIQALQVEVDATNRVYVTGSFYGIVDFDPNATAALRVGGTVPGASLFVVRLDSNGTFQYADTYQATEVYDGKFDVSPVGEVVLTGRYRGTLDLDPNAGIVAATSAGFSGFVTKISTSGTMLWGKFLDATAASYIESPTPLFDSTGNVIVTGGYTGDVDFDPSLAGVQQLTSTDPSYADMFILKLDPAGGFTSVVSIGGSDTTISHDAALDGAGNLVIVGELAGFSDFDPSPADGTRFSLGDSMFVATYDAALNFVDATVILGFGGTINGHAVAVDAAGNAHIAGEFSGTIDFSGVGNDNRTANNNGAFLLKLNSSGMEVYASTYDAISVVGSDVALDSAGNAYLVGSIEGTVDFDPHGGIYNLNSNGDGADIFATKVLAAAAGTLTATLFAGSLTIDDIDPVGRDNQFSISVQNDILQISDPVEQFQIAPAGGWLSSDRRTVYFPTNLLANPVYVNGGEGDDQFFVGDMGSVYYLIMSGDGGINTFGSAAQPITPRVNTAIDIFGGSTANPVAPITSNQPGDTLYLDLVSLPADTAVAVATLEGKVFATHHAYFGFSSVETLHVSTRDNVPIEMGDLFIQGGTGNDVICVSPISGKPDRVNVRLNGVYFSTQVNRPTLIVSGDGNDLVSHAGVPFNAKIWGQGGDDALSGGEGDDQLIGGDGNDSLQGQGGQDYLQGGAGNDALNGGAGNDHLFGDTGDDYLRGEAGIDLLVGNAGADTLQGDTGDDLLIGGADGDTLHGNDGDDLMLSGETTHGVSTQSGDLADISLASLLFTWSTLHPGNMASAILSPNDQAHDDLFGDAGNDDFYLGGGDLAVDFSAGDETF